MTDHERCRELARAALLAGTLPTRSPDVTWGGPGAGIDCVVCGVAIPRDLTELEIEVAGGALHFHVKCFAAWHVELICRAN